MKRVSKTFQEGDEVGPPCLFAADIIWKTAATKDFVDPAEAEYYLRYKVKVTIEIHCPDENPFQNDIIDAYDRKRNS